MSTLTQFDLSAQLIRSRFFSKVKLSPSARLVLVVLCSHYPNIYPSLKTIQNEAGIASKQSVISALKELAKQGLLLYETKGSNHYTFTGLFFERLDVQKLDTNKQGQNKEINKFQKFQNSKFVQPGITYPKYQPEQKRKESPLELDREGAEEFLRNLPQRMQGSFFATELRKKWNIEAIKNPLCVSRCVL